MPRRAACTFANASGQPLNRLGRIALRLASSLLKNRGLHVGGTSIFLSPLTARTSCCFSVLLRCGGWDRQGGDADKRKGLMSMAYSDFAPFMADVDEAFKTWDKVTLVKLSNLPNVPVR